MAGAAPILLDWLGEGMEPVSSLIALERVKSCLYGFNGEKCPNNISPNWAQKHLSDPIARVMLKQLLIRNELKMALPEPLESKTHYCSKCGCNIRLKIHVPIKHISSHHSVEEFKEYPTFCWLRLEMEALSL